VSTHDVSRRRLLGVVAGGAAVAAAGIGASTVLGRGETATAGEAASDVPFHGAHQAGITTPPQDRLHITAFDIVTTDPREVVVMLQRWTEAARMLTAGRPIGRGGALMGNPEAPPDDTGEALGLPAAGLTLTVGFGPSMFDRRFGLAIKSPPLLVPLPHFSGDALDPAISDGDIVIQACADDAQVALHAVRQLTRIGAGVVNPRWAQLGFTPTRGLEEASSTPRNLHGFKDGTHNLDVLDPRMTAEQLWADARDGQSWMAGGTYLVSRRIRMLIETWDRSSLNDQEEVIGRHKGSGAPLGAQDEHAIPDFGALGADGGPLIALDSHVRLAHPDHNAGARLLRRGYSFADGVDRLGRLDAGLFFLAFQRDPHRQFVPIQTRMSRIDALNEYIRHESSALWACPPGVSESGYWGDTLFG
jgi:deferrochelatase/peroxidase EfeB